MHPILVDIGSFSLHSYGALAAVGFLVVVALSIVRGRRLGIDADTVVNVIFVTALAGVVGARGVWVLQNLDAISSPLDVVNLRTGGLVFYGAILLGVPAAMLEMRRRGLPIGATFDLFGTALPLGHAISRLGCYFAGCCYGTPTDLPWAVRFDHPLTDAPHGVALHPVQLYEMASLLAIAAVCNATYPRRWFDGQIMLTYLGLYAVSRFALELVRGDASRGSFLGTPLSLSQGIATLIAVLVVAAMALLARRGEGPTTAVSIDRGGAR